MKHLGRKITSAIIVLVMAISMLPVQAFASLLDNDPVYNREMLDAIREVVGSEEEASLYYDLMEHYGLLDDDGNLLQSWSVRMDGEDLTTDELREILAGEFDPEKYVFVDGTPITLEDVKTMIEIEDYVVYIRDTYYSGNEWTQEQKDAYDDLLEQINTSGITFKNNVRSTGASSAGSSRTSARLDQGARVTVNQIRNGVFEAILTGAAPGQVVDLTTEVVPLNGLRNGTRGTLFQPYRMVADENGYSSIILNEAEDQATYSFESRLGADKCVVMVNFGVSGGALFVNEDGEDCRNMCIMFAKNSPSGDYRGLMNKTVSISAWECQDAMGDSYIGWDLPLMNGIAPQGDSGAIKEILRLIGEGFYSSYTLELTAQVLIPERFTHSGAGVPHAVDGYVTYKPTLNRRSDRTGAPGIIYDFWEGNTGKINIPLNQDFTYTKTVTKGITRYKVYELKFTADPQTTDFFQMLWDIDNTPAPSGETYTPFSKMLVFDPAGGHVYYGGTSSYEWTLVGANLVFTDDVKPEIDSIVWRPSVEESGYATGMGVPIEIKFTEPVQASTTAITVNGIELKAIRSAGNSAYQVFVYPVPLVDNNYLEISAFCATDLMGNMKDSRSSANFDPLSYEGVVINPLFKYQTFTGVHASVGWDANARQYLMNISADISSDPEVTAWMTQEQGLFTLNNDGQYEFRDLYFTIYIPDYIPAGASGPRYNGETIWLVRPTLVQASEYEVTGGQLRVTIPLDLGDYFLFDNAGAQVGQVEPLDCTVGLFLASEFDNDGTPTNGEMLFGVYDTTQIMPLNLIDPQDLRVRVTVDYPDPDFLDFDMTFPFEGQQDPSLGLYRIPVNLGGDPEIRAFVVLDREDYTFGDTGYTTIMNPNQPGYLLDEQAHFLWRAVNLNDGNAGTIDKDGYILPTGQEGYLCVAAWPINGLITTTVNYFQAPFYLDFIEGYKPYLSIPGSNRTREIMMSTAFPLPYTINWNSNLPKKADGNEVTFHIALGVRDSDNPGEFERDGTGELLVYEADVTCTKNDPVSSHTIPENWIAYQYYNESYNHLLIKISCTFDGTEYVATMKLDVLSPPARVRFDYKTDNNSFYIVDTAGSVEIPWTINSFAHFGTAEDLFEMRITKAGGASDVAVITDPGTGDGYGNFTGSYTLNIDDVISSPSNPGSFREVYVVTIKAKNGSDSTWSYDSFLLYVYDQDALKITVDGEKRDSFVMSNRDQFSAMLSEEILSYEREISLHNDLSINYGEFAWAELTDRLSWESSDNSVATINYKQGVMYNDIRKYTYEYYRPTTEFVLSGLSDGNTVITATHGNTQMTAELDVTVETMKNKLYLFQFYPKTVTDVTYYVNGSDDPITVSSNSDGALAIYAETGIRGLLSCSSTAPGTGGSDKAFLGTFRAEDLVSGERDSTRLELYPCNFLELRQAAYAYIYLKKPNGEPYTGDVIFRGGVYLDGCYVDGAKFSLNTNAAPSVSGAVDQFVTLDQYGKLEIVMDQTQWTGGAALTPDREVRYAFLVKAASGGEEYARYYPLLIEMDASVNTLSYVSSGDAIVNFRTNTAMDQSYRPVKHPFLILQYTVANGTRANVLHTSSRVGINDTTTSSTLTSVALWWGEDAEADAENSLQIFTSAGDRFAYGAGQYTNRNSNSAYPFVGEEMTEYTIEITEESLGSAVPRKSIANAYMEFYRDGEVLSRKEDMRLQICNLLGVGAVNESGSVMNDLRSFGSVVGTSGSNSLSTEDSYVNMILNLVSTSNFTDGDEHLFEVKIAPTADPTRFLGFVQANYGDRIEGAGDTGMSLLDPDDIELEGELDIKDRLEMAVTNPNKWKAEKKKEINEAKNNTGGGDTDTGFSLGGYMEVLIYYSFAEQEWRMQPLYGGFHVGGSIEYNQVWNEWIGYVPVTMELTAGGNVEVSMDAITTSYIPSLNRMGDIEFGTEFLTQLRIFLYLKVFAGVGVDYSVFAVKLGIYGMISIDMQFEWLNRPYLSDHPDALLLAAGEDAEGFPLPAELNEENANLSGQHLRINGQIGLELVIKALGFEFDWAIFSVSFDMLNRSFNSYESIERHWENNQLNMQRAIETLLDNGDATFLNANRNLVAVSMAPKVESREYLKNGDSVWGYTPRRGPASVINNLESNTYPYADPEMTRDGELVVYLTDMRSTDVAKTRVAFATSGWPTYVQGGVIDDSGFGDSQLAADGTGSFAVAAWTRQTVDMKLEADSVVTVDDQRVMMDGNDIYASVYSNGQWTTTRLTEGNGADLAPTVAVKGRRAVVAWRSVISDATEVLKFVNKDTILYKTYEDGVWSEAKSLYNGTNGTVKAITSAMLDNGTAAVAYTLDTDLMDETIADREIVYAVIGADGEVIRNIRCTNDEKLDENPQITTVVFPQDGSQRFLLGWYTQSVDSSVSGAGSDICLLDFDSQGITGQLIPESMSKIARAADVSVTSNFRFSKNASSITDLSLIWVERDNSLADDQNGENAASTAAVSHDMSGESVEKDVLKGIKFYLYGENDQFVGLTDALSVAEMSDATLINHFDAYTSNGTEIKAVILGTSYGLNGEVDNKSAVTTNGVVIDYTVPRATYAMYTATDTYTNSYDIQAVAVDYEAVRLGSDTKIGFSVRNGGIEPITSIEVDLDGETTTFSGFELLPGHTKEIWADYMVPNSGVVDPDYTVTANFKSWNGSIVTPEVEAGTVIMDLPDLQIISSEIIEEVDGTRTIQIKLNNRQDSALEGSGRKVRLSFWKDPTCETPIGAIGMEDILITSDSDLRLIDEGGYSVQVVFDVAGYLRGEGNEIVEISEGGVPVYISADVLQNVEGVDLIVPEPVDSNNYSHVVCDNLMHRTGHEVLMSSDLVVENGTTTVTVHLQNTTLTPNTSRNLIVYLLDADGRIIAQRETYDPDAPDSGLITLGAEEKKDVTLVFDTTCQSMRYAFTDLIAGSNTAELTSVSLAGIQGVTLADLALGTAEVSVDDMNSLRVEAEAVSPLSLITVSLQTGEETVAMQNTSVYSYLASGALHMIPGQTSVLTIRVENPMAEGDTMNEYTLTIHNNGAPEIGTPAFTIDKDLQTGATTAVISVEAGPQPASPGYEIAYHWYECDVNGENLSEIQNCSGSLTDTLTVTDDFGAEPKFYVCEVIRTYVDDTVSSGLYFSEPCGIFFGNLIILRTKDFEKTFGDPDPINGYYVHLIPKEEMFELEGNNANRVEEAFLLFGNNLTFAREEGEDVGTYAITPTLSTNYWTDPGDYYNESDTYFIVTVPGTFTINQAEYTVRADEKTKMAGEDDPEFTVTVSGDNYLGNPNVISYEISREAGEEPGTYAINVTGEADQGNYHVTFVSSTLTIVTGHSHDGLVFEPWPYTDSVPTSGNWYLLNDVTIKKWYVGYDPEVNICLNGHTITITGDLPGAMEDVEIYNGAELNIFDDTGEGAILGSRSYERNKDSVILVRDGATLNLYGGQIRSADGYSLLQGVVSVNGNGVFNMYGGSVSGGAGYGGGVHVGYGDYSGNEVVYSTGTFNLYGGSIENNHLAVDSYYTYGAGVYVEKGTFTMNGGVIRGNSVQGSEFNVGAGVFVDSEGVFAMNGGRIENNTASGAPGSCAAGGGVLNAGSMTLNGGTLKGNAGGDLGLFAGDGQNEYSVNVGGLPEENCSVVILSVDADDNWEYAGGIFASGLDDPNTVFYSYIDGLVVVTTPAGEARLADRNSVDVYEITFLDEDGSELARADTAGGEFPVYPGQVPEKTGYIFSGWTPAIQPADAVSTYTAVYTRTSDPFFARYALLLSSEIGIKFRVSFPENFDATGCRVDFAAADGSRLSVAYANAETIDNSTDRYFTFYVNALELADTVTATLHYGNDRTVVNEYSVMTYIETVRQTMSDNTKLIDLVNALQTYGYYMQHSGWTDNKQTHTDIPDPSVLLNDASVAAAKDAVDSMAVVKEDEHSVLSDAKFSLTLNEKTVINITVKPADGVLITSGGYTVRDIGGETYYQFSTAPIGARNLGTEYTIEVATDHGKATVTASAMSYVRAALNSGSLAEGKRLAMAAYYQYYVAADRY